MSKRPIILWTCDVPGWAYHNRIKRLEKAMPQYEFQIWYFGNPVPAATKARILREAAVIVCQGVKALRIVEQKELAFSTSQPNQFNAVMARRWSNIVARLDSLRIDIDGEYVDIWTGGH